MQLALSSIRTRAPLPGDRVVDPYTETGQAGLVSLKPRSAQLAYSEEMTSPSAQSEELPPELQEEFERDARKFASMTPQEHAARVSDSLELLEPRLFARRAKQFDSTDFRKLSASEIRGAFNQVLRLDHADSNNVIFSKPTLTLPVPVGGILWRARPLDSGGIGRIAEQVPDERGVWEAPPENVDTLRFNFANQPRLYVSANSPIAPVAEVRAKPGDIVLLSRFNVQQPVNLQKIDFELDSRMYTGAARYNWRMIYRFLHAQLTREVHEDSLLTYEVTSLITEEYFNLPPGVADGIAYESTLVQNQLNAAIYPEAGHEKLNWQASIAVEIRDVHPGSSFRPIAYALPPSASVGTLEWAPCTDERWLHLFADLLHLMT